MGERAGKWLMPLIALYAGFLGLKILIKAFRQPVAPGKAKRIGLLAAVGGFLDSFGGGGWGPIVTSTLVAKGRSPRYTVGSVSLTEFFVTLASAFTFLVTVGITHLTIVLGLLTGGCIAAPIAARLAGKLPRKTMMIAVGVMVLVWCVRMFLKSIL
ncbi:MAG: sulfite exporter TauE/SafE family protein [Chitinophagaceae bacterium]|nr:MAG: sulfite exporter TauE/SafE family protein [Chitinophagaceae bacterium]